MNVINLCPSEKTTENIWSSGQEIFSTVSRCILVYRTHGICKKELIQLTEIIDSNWKFVVLYIFQLIKYIVTAIYLLKWSTVVHNRKF